MVNVDVELPGFPERSERRSVVEEMVVFSSTSGHTAYRDFRTILEFMTGFQAVYTQTKFFDLQHPLFHGKSRHRDARCRGVN